MIITITRIEVPNVIKPHGVTLWNEKAAAFIQATGLNVSFAADIVSVYGTSREISFQGKGCVARINVGDGIDVMLDIAHKIATGK